MCVCVCVNLPHPENVHLRKECIRWVLFVREEVLGDGTFLALLRVDPIVQGEFVDLMDSGVMHCSGIQIGLSRRASDVRFLQDLG